MTIFSLDLNLIDITYYILFSIVITNLIIGAFILFSMVIHKFSIFDTILFMIKKTLQKASKFIGNGIIYGVAVAAGAESSLNIYDRFKEIFKDWFKK